ncbi:MAG TPA: hypothetical protein VII36_11370 [Usitatibacter sp.]
MRNISRTAMAVLALACATATTAAMTKQDYKAAKQRIAAEYAAERPKCAARHGKDADLCVARAHGVRDVAKAELEAAYRPSPRTNYGAAIARSKAAYAVAKDECYQQKDAARKECLAEAKVAHDRADAEAKTARKASIAEEAAPARK